MKISFSGGPPVEHEDIMRNVEFSRATGFPFFRRNVAPHGRVLAVVGGGPSVLAQVEELRQFEGDLWAVNGACNWLRSHGIESTMIAVDPHPIVGHWAQGVKKALLCSRVDSKVFGVMKDAEIVLFDLVMENATEGIVCASSTATCAFHLAVEMGYRKIVFYGCESSYPGSEIGNADDMTHAYLKEVRDERMLVSCGDEEYLTAPDFYVQATELAEVLRKFPAHFSERGGGLLRAMIENDEHDIIKVSRCMMAMLTPIPLKQEIMEAQ